ncbi:hypothetical protein K466DRAFT_360676 [Polyporus arcularius HHB13444]|uniref:Uncharacterized protein n=1 Tax=Polyporus arcularius HHB13444 TaxID=1314778 RepID=A0A5C3PMW1_9APHY|nr:hypothetical protein K466DRAFT_360676 [Polyporus arcularius HHB13444]
MAEHLHCVAASGPAVCPDPATPSRHHSAVSYLSALCYLPKTSGRSPVAPAARMCCARELLLYCLPRRACLCHASVPHARNRMAASLSAIDPSTHLDPKTAGMSSGVLLTHITQAAPGNS